MEIFTAVGVTLIDLSAYEWAINSKNWIIIGAFGAVSLTIALLLSFIKIITKINQKGIYMKFYPFQLKYKFYPWKNIKEIKAITRKRNDKTIKYEDYNKGFDGWIYTVRLQK